MNMAQKDHFADFFARERDGFPSSGLSVNEHFDMLAQIPRDFARMPGRAKMRPLLKPL